MIRQPIVINAYKHILQLLRQVNHFPYHNIGHTLDVFRRARELGIAENISDEEMEDLLIGALFHDTGFIVAYAKNEPIGAQIARAWLEKHAHPEARIARVERIILATVLFAQPQSILEEIIQDADLDNLGRTDGLDKTARYAEELEIHSEHFNLQNYLKFTERLYQNFSFNTKTARHERAYMQHNNLLVLREKYGLAPTE